MALATREQGIHAPLVGIVPQGQPLLYSVMLEPLIISRAALPVSIAYNVTKDIIAMLLGCLYQRDFAGRATTALEML